MPNAPAITWVLLGTGLGLSVCIAIVVQLAKAIADACGARELDWWGKVRAPALKTAALVIGAILGVVVIPEAVAMVEAYQVPKSLAAVGGAGCGAASEYVYRWVRSSVPGLLDAVQKRVAGIVGRG